VNFQEEARWQRYVTRSLIRGAPLPTTRLASKDLPLDTEDAIIGLTPGDEELALLDLGGIGRDRDRAHERTHDRFARRVKQLAAALVAGLLSLLVWHRLMRDAVKTHALQQALLGGDGVILDLPRVSGLVRRETDYLSRFADAVARDGVTPLLASRAALYGGSGRAVFYRERETSLPIGYVVEYQSHDDGSTCKPCSSAEGLYLPGSGPFPGEVCLGHSRCRCVRVPKYNPERATLLGYKI
jgi:hypothetical protein